MRNNLLLSALVFTMVSASNAQNCDINANASPIAITCGQSTTLSAFGSSNGQVILDEDFNTGGFGPGWGATPGATSFGNPCSPGGVDGTPHAWMDNNTSVPRTLTSAPYNLSGATAGVTICFDLLFAEQGNAAPCEGPDEPDEGVFLQYSTDGGATWIDIHYFDPNGGNDPQLTNWNNWCFALPPGAITGNTIIRWHQTADSGADYDHWGIDNVQIFQNDINAEIVWLHDGYSYGVGNGGGDNPTDVSPITTTTYTSQITTGTGDVCTADVTVIVLDPVYDVNVTATPSTICAGDCATINGDATIVIDPGGIETYENNQLEIVATGAASVNINIQTLNMTGVDPGSIQEICVNGFNFSGTELCTNFFGGCNCNGTNIAFGESCNVDVSSFNITVTSPSGCQITLVPANTIVSTGIQDMCFVPAGGTPISGGSGNYNGQFDPNEPISDFDGCTANGVWTLEFNTGTGGLGFGFGSLTGWNITFNDPPIYAPVDISWSPTTGLSNPSSINTDACPASSTDYELTVSNGTPGCPEYTETVSITVNPCGGCIAPDVIVNPLNVCSPATADLSASIGAGSDPATLSYHATQADAQNDVSPIATAVGTSGSYWVRAEDPADPTCFNVYEIDVTINPLDDASFTLTDYCAGSANSATGIATVGGTFAFNPVPGGGVTIDPATGSITNGLSGNTYTVQYTTLGACPSSSTETVTVSGLSYTASIVDENCGAGDGEIDLTPVGGTPAYTYSIDNGATTQAGGLFTGLVVGTYDILITDNNGCQAIGTETIANIGGPTVTMITPTNPSCPGVCDGQITVTVTGGTAPYTYEWFDGLGNPVGTNSATITGLCDDNYSVQVTDAGGGGATQLNTNSGFEVGPGGGCGCPTGFNCNNDAGQVFDGVMPVYVPGNLGCATGATNYTNALGANSGTGYVYFYAGSDNVSAGPYAFLGGETVDLCVWYAGPQGGGTAGQNTAASHFSFGMDGVQIGPDVPVPTNTGWTQYCYTVVMTAGNHTFQILSGGAAQYALWFDDFTINNMTGGGGAGCTVTANASLIDPLPADPSFTLTDFCFGAANTATITGTVGGTFAFNPNPMDGSTINATTGEITNAVAGTTYSIEYTTPGACPETSIETVDAQVCCNIVLNVLATVSPTCGQADGEINLQAVGGDGNYTFSINGGAFNASSLFLGLTSGTYQIEVQDGSGAACSDIIDVDLTDLDGPIISAVNVTNPLCNGDVTGEIEVIANGGVGTLDYEIVNVTPVANTTGLFTGLTEANYTINVTDANGCLATSNAVIVEPTAVTINAQGTDVSCFGANDGTIDILAGGGTPAYNYSIDNGATWTTNANYTGLSAQNYEVIVEDANGCQSPMQVVLIVENGLLQVNSVVVSESCYNSCDGSITLNVAGGNAPYSYSFNGGPSVVSNIAANLCAGNQNYIVTDANGCSANGNDIIIAGVRIQPVIVSVVDDGCSDICDGEIQVTSATGISYTLNGVTNATGLFTDLCEDNYTITVYDANNCNETVQTIVSTSPPVQAGFNNFPGTLTIFESIVNLINTSTNASDYIWEITSDYGYYATYTSENVEHEFPSDTGEYTICLTAINTIGGCQDQYCISLVVEDDIAIYVPNAFTPDGDEYNQTFRAYVNGVDIYDFDFLIFNRWGELIWENHDPNEGWDGTYNGKLVQEGAYVWKIVVKDIEFDDRRTYSGHVTILK